MFIYFQGQQVNLPEGNVNIITMIHHVYEWLSVSFDHSIERLLPWTSEAQQLTMEKKERNMGVLWVEGASCPCVWVCVYIYILYLLYIDIYIYNIYILVYTYTYIYMYIYIWVYLTIYV
jgi:hypothetical protein